MKTDKPLWQANESELDEALQAAEQERRAIVNKAVQARDDYVDGAVAGLLAAGVSKDQITIQYHPDSVVKIKVDGVEKISHQIKIENGSEYEGTR